MKPALMFLVIVAMLLGAAAPHSAAAQDCKPVVGHFEARIVTEGCTALLCTAGRVWGGIQGTYDFAMTSVVPSGRPDVPTIFFFTGDSTISLKSGDELRGVDTGVIDPARGGFASLITFTGGTGAMTNATGQIRLRGELDEDTTSGDYIGTLCTQ
jgi:hypothetical protein